MPLGRRTRRLAAAIAVLGAAAAVASHRQAPGSDAEVSGTAQPVRFVHAEAPPATGGVWFLTVTERRRAPLERLLHRDRPEVVREEAVSPFDADDSFLASQELARDVATRYDPHGRVVLASGLEGAPRLRPGDALVALDGAPVTTVRQAAKVIQRWEQAESRPLVVTIARDGVHQHIPVEGSRHGRRLSLPLARVASVPLEEVGDVRGGAFHGASGGLAFALAYLDRVSGGALLAGRPVAATGVLTNDYGAVEEVGSVAEKAEAAVAAGAEVLFVPEANVDDVPAGLGVPVVGVTNVRDAIRWLCTHQQRDCGPFEPRRVATPHGLRPVSAPLDELRWDG